MTRFRTDGWEETSLRPVLCPSSVPCSWLPASGSAQVLLGDRGLLSPWRLVAGMEVSPALRQTVWKSALRGACPVSMVVRSRASRGDWKTSLVCVFLLSGHERNRSKLPCSKMPTGHGVRGMDGQMGLLSRGRAGLCGVAVWCLAPALFPVVVEGSSSLKTVPLSGRTGAHTAGRPWQRGLVGWPPTRLPCGPSSAVLQLSGGPAAGRVDLNQVLEESLTVLILLHLHLG